MIEKKLYKFKSEFCKELKIPVNQMDRRQPELLNWLSNFYDFDFLPGNPIKINIKEIYGEYQPLPKKTPNQDKLNEEKEKKYEQFTIASLGPKFKPNSKTRIAREAIYEFGRKEFHHTSAEAVAKRFIRKPFEKYGETNDKWRWVWYSSYEPLDKETTEKWRAILREENIAEEQAANAFYKAAEGEDVTKEIGFYKKAQQRMIELYQDFPVRVKEWKIK